MTHPRCPMLPVETPLVRKTTFSILILGAVLLLALSADLLAADPAAEARSKLVDMVAGDISRSLAVADRTADGTADSAVLKGLSSTFPGSVVYGMGNSTYGQLGVGLSSDTNVPIQLSPDLFGGPIASSYHTLAVDRDGNLWAAGDDASGQFGDGSASSSTMTLFQTSQTNVASVAVGTYHSLVVMDDGTVIVTGEGSMGQLGNGGTDTDTFASIDLPWAIKDVAQRTDRVIGYRDSPYSSIDYYVIPGALRAAAFGNNSYVITESGELYVSGENSAGELGTGIAGSPSLTPVRVIDGGVVDVAAGIRHTLALMADGSVMAMGLNTYGQFGDGTTDSSTTPKVVIPGGVNSIAAGNGYSMFLMADGSLRGAGSNSYGQLGTGDTAVHNTLTVVANDVVGVASGFEHVLYVTNSGVLMGMGKNSNGQLGLGDFVSRYSADTIVSDGVARAFADYNVSYYILNSVSDIRITGLDRAYAGRTANYQCEAIWADGRRTDITAEAVWSDNSAAAAITLNTGVLDLSGTQPGETIRVSAAYFGRTATKDVAVVRTPVGGAVLYGHGSNNYSHLGLDTIVNQLTPIQITADRIVSAAGGRGHSLYVREDGSVFTMGDNTYGQLGTGDTIPQTTPARVPLDKPALAVGAGDYHSLIVTADGSLYAMGRGGEGQLGVGLQNDSYPVEDFRMIPSLVRRAGVTGADGGAGHTVFITAGGEVWTAGRNIEGQLGNGSTTAETSPKMVHSANAAAIAAGKDYTLFATDDSALWGMGDNTHGQLGLISSIVSQLTPTTLATSGVDRLAAGGYHSAYITPSGQLYASGRNVAGQLGNGTFTDQYGFSLVDLGAAANGIHAGEWTTFIRTGARTYTDTAPTDYTWYATGDNSDGQFGDGTTTTVNTPKALLHSGVKDIWLGSRHVLFTSGLPGDVDGDVQYTLHDAVRALQVMSGQYDGWPVAPHADIDGDGRIGLPEAQHALRRAGGF